MQWGRIKQGQGCFFSGGPHRRGDVRAIAYEVYGYQRKNVPGTEEHVQRPRGWGQVLAGLCLGRAQVSTNYK